MHQISIQKTIISFLKKKMIKSHNKNITHFMCYAKYSVTQEKTQVIKCNAKIAKSTTAGHFIA